MGWETEEELQEVLGTKWQVEGYKVEQFIYEEEKVRRFFTI